MSGLVGFDWTGGRQKLGDFLSRTSLPENYYKNTGDKLINLGDSEFFRYNPFCISAQEIHPNTLSRVEKRSIWNYTIGNICNANCKTMAHELCRNWGLEKVYKFGPDLYLHNELTPYPKTIAVHTTGNNQGTIPIFVLNHIREVYKDYLLIQIGGVFDIDAPFDIDRRGAKWEMTAKMIAESEIFIGPDSFCMWVAKCYGKVHKKLILVNKDRERCENFWPRGFGNEYPNNPFDTWVEVSDGLQIYNTFSENLGVTQSYLNI